MKDMNMNDDVIERLNEIWREFEEMFYLTPEMAKEMDWEELKRKEEILNQHVMWWYSEGQFCGEDNREWHLMVVGFAEDALEIIRKRLQELGKEDNSLPEKEEVDDLFDEEFPF